VAADDDFLQSRQPNPCVAVLLILICAQDDFNGRIYAIKSISVELLRPL
jgi:hypothetical protein